MAGDHTVSGIPMKTIVGEVIARYAEQTKTLLNCVVKEEGSLCKEMQKLIEIDTELQTVKDLLVKHQRFQKKLIHIQEQISHKDNRIKHLALQLKNIEKSIEKILFNSKTLINRDSSLIDIYRGGSSALVDVDELIKYSQLIASTTTAATHDMELMQDLFQPPAPQEYQIQSGILYQASGFEATTENETEQDNEPIYKLEATEAGSSSPHHEKPAVISLDEVAIDNTGDDDLDDLVWD